MTTSCSSGRSHDVELLLPLLLLLHVAALLLLMNVRHSICHMRQDASAPCRSSQFLPHTVHSLSLSQFLPARLRAAVPHLNLWSTMIITNRMYANCARNAFAALANQFNQILCCCLCASPPSAKGVSICTYLHACKLINWSSAGLVCNCWNLIWDNWKIFHGCNDDDNDDCPDKQKLRLGIGLRLICHIEEISCPYN